MIWFGMPNSSPPPFLSQPNTDASSLVIVDEKNTSIFECCLDPQQRRNVTGPTAVGFFDPPKSWRSRRRTPSISPPGASRGERVQPEFGPALSSKTFVRFCSLNPNPA